MDGNDSSGDRNDGEIRHESEDSNLSGENVDIRRINEEFYEDKIKARWIPVKLPNCRCDTPPVIDGERPGPSGLQPPVDRSHRKGDVLYTMFHRPNGKQPAVKADNYLSSSDSEEDEGPYQRERFKKKLKKQGFIHEAETAHCSTDPAFSDIYGDQQPFDGPSNGRSDPPEPEWPKDVPIRKGDILYMMFQRPPKDKEAKYPPEKAEKPKKRSATETPATAGRANREHIIKRFKDDLENARTYSPDVRRSNSCFEHQQIIEELPMSSRSQPAVAATDMDTDHLYMFHGPPDITGPSSDADLLFRASPSSSTGSQPYLSKPSSSVSLNPYMASSGSQHSVKDERCSNGFKILPEWPSRKDMMAQKPATTKAHKNQRPSASRSPGNHAAVRRRRKRKRGIDRNDLVITNDNFVFCSYSDHSTPSSKRRREEIERDSSCDELEELPPTQADLTQNNPESMRYHQEENAFQEEEVHETNCRYDRNKKPRNQKPRLTVRFGNKFS